MKIIINIFEFVNKLAKSVSDRLYKFESTVFVIVKIDNLNEFSKSKLSKIKTPESVKILIKKDIKTKNDKLISSLKNFFVENKIL